MKRAFNLLNHCHTPPKVIKPHRNTVQTVSASTTTTSDSTKKVHVHLHAVSVLSTGDIESSQDAAVLRRLLKGRNVKITFGEFADEPTYDILVSGTPTLELLDASKRLKIVVVPWAGILPAMRSMMLKYPHLSVHNLHWPSIPTAEMALTLLLAASKQLIVCDQALRRQDWRPRYRLDMQPFILHGKKALILGYGTIGECVRDYLLTLGMKVVAIKRNPSKVKHHPQVEVFGPESLHELLPKVDVLMVILPGIPSTLNYISKRELDLLPKHSILVNVGRGSVIHQTDLFNALKNGDIGAAGLDVWYNYPGMLEDSPRVNIRPSTERFEDLDNVVLSPHRGGAVPPGERTELRASSMAELIKAFYDEKPIPNKMNLELGY
uniref:Dehydrogenase n=1 Tax=Hirondellea gigas TaxID=1518452 RepID=A0A6A7GCI0_9CRUS